MYLLTSGTDDDDTVIGVLSHDSGALLSLPESRQPVEQFLRFRCQRRFVVGHHFVDVVVKVGLGPRSAAFHLVGDATRAEHVQTGQDPRSVVFAVAQLAALLLVLIVVVLGRGERIEYIKFAEEYFYIHIN